MQHKYTLLDVSLKKTTVVSDKTCKWQFLLNNQVNNYWKIKNYWVGFEQMPLITILRIRLQPGPTVPTYIFSFLSQKLLRAQSQNRLRSDLWACACVVMNGWPIERDKAHSIYTRVLNQAYWFLTAVSIFDSG